MICIKYFALRDLSALVPMYTMSINCSIALTPFEQIPFLAMTGRQHDLVKADLEVFTCPNHKIVIRQPHIQFIS